MILGRHHAFNHLGSDPAGGPHRPVLVRRLHDWKVEELALLLELGQVLIQDYIELYALLRVIKVLQECDWSIIERGLSYPFVSHSQFELTIEIKDYIVDYLKHRCNSRPASYHTHIFNVFSLHPLGISIPYQKF